MFSKRVKAIRGFQQEISILEKKTEREVSKFYFDVVREIEKRLKRVHPACRIELDPIGCADFNTNKRKKGPMRVFIRFMNGAQLNTKNEWFKGLDVGWNNVEIVENHVSGPQMVEICRELSENLGISVEMIRFEV